MKPEKNEQKSGKLNSEQLGNVSGGFNRPYLCLKCGAIISEPMFFKNKGYCNSCKEAMQNG